MSEYKTAKEILDSNDENEILGILRNWIMDGEEFFEQKKTTFRYCQNIRNAVVHPDYPLAFKHFLPLARKAIISAKAVSIGQQFSNVPFWGQIRAKNETNDRIEAKLLQKIVETNIYDFNKFYSIADKVEEEKFVYGTGIFKDSWQYKTRELKHVIKENLSFKEDETDNINKSAVNQVSNQENLPDNTNDTENQTINIQENEMTDTAMQSSIVEYDESIKTEIEVISDSNCIDYVSIWNIIFDPTASELENCRFVYEKHFFDEDELKEMFENYEDYRSFREEKRYSNNGNSSSQSSDFNTKDGTTTNEDERRNQMEEILEFYAYDKLFWTTSDGDFLFIPKNTTEKTKFLNPYTHCQYPYSIVYYIQDNYSIYGKGMIDDDGLGDLNLAANNLFNLAIEGVFAKSKAPIGINRQFCHPSQVKKAMSSFGGIFEIINNPQSQSQIMFQPNLDYNAGELFNTFQAMDGYIQNFSNQTNFQTGGTDVKGYNKTLGGIQAILQESRRKISYSNKINQDALQEMMFRCFSNIFQFSKENIVVEVIGDDGLEFYEITTKFNNNKSVNFTGTLKKNQKIYSLDEIAKLKYTFNIDFAAEDGNKVIRNQKLQQALSVATNLMTLGNINIMPIVKEYFDTLNITGVVKDTKDEMKKIQKENWHFVRVMYDAELALNNGKISQRQYNAMLVNAVEPPSMDDDDIKHIENHHPDMFEHIAIHQANLQKKQAMAQAMQRQMQQQQQENQGIDARQAVSANPRNLKPGDNASVINNETQNNNVGENNVI